MPHFYFHVHNGFGVARDGQGSEHANLDEACIHAAIGARSMLSSEVMDGRIDLRGRVEIADNENREVAVVKFADVVQILTGPLPNNR